MHFFLNCYVLLLHQLLCLFTMLATQVWRTGNYPDIVIIGKYLIIGEMVHAYYDTWLKCVFLCVIVHICLLIDRTFSSQYKCSRGRGGEALRKIEKFFYETNKFSMKFFAILCQGCAQKLWKKGAQQQYQLIYSQVTPTIKQLHFTLTSRIPPP